jgi:hypothetical protein
VTRRAGSVLAAAFAALVAAPRVHADEEVGPIGISFAAFGGVIDLDQLDAGVEVGFDLPRRFELFLEGATTLDTEHNRGGAGARYRIIPGWVEPFVHAKIIATSHESTDDNSVRPCVGMGVDLNWRALFLRVQEGYCGFFESRLALGVSF